MENITMLRNPVLLNSTYSKTNNPAGNVLEEIAMQEVGDQVVGGYNSNALGNQGILCSITQECQHICNWTLWCW